EATLEDYALLADGLLALAAAGGEVAYATTARDLVDRALAGEVTADPVLAGQGLVSPPAGDDSVLPSGPSALAAACHSLWVLGAGEQYRDAAARLVREGSVAALAQPVGGAGLLRIALALRTAPHQMVVVHDGEGSTNVSALTEDARGADIVAVVSSAAAQSFADAGFAL